MSTSSEYVVGILWGSRYDDFETAIVVDHWLGVDQFDVTELAKEHVEHTVETDDKFQYFWMLVANGQPEQITFAGTTSTNQVESINA